MGLYDKLTEYGESGRYPMHMPGHKRNPGFCSLPDITEIDGFDDLHDARGILKKAMDDAAELYGSKRCFYLVNGSTCGILAAICAMTKSGDKILIGRNCHKSVYNAVYINSLRPVYLYPETEPQLGLPGHITPESVEKALTKSPDIGLVVITSPAYEGVTSDIRAIADICHRHGSLLLVDEAHGAHFGFSPMFPENAVRLGADVVVMSLHKTLPSMTQTALLHICSDSVDIAKISYMLSVFETSSPSYILMASMEKCIETLKKDGAHLFSDYEKNLTEFYGRISNLKHLAYLSGHNIDPGKIVISTLGADISGPELAGKIRDIGFEPEMAGPEHVIAMTSICDTNDALMELAQGLLEIDAGLHDSKNDFSIKFPVQSQAAMSPREAVDGISEVVPIRDAAGKIAAEYLYMYPPGCPLIVPGEVISDETLAQAEKMLRLGLHIYSSSGGYPAKLEVIGID